ncbi:MAG: GTPase ObgE [Lachnospiraceae bacterium]|nr:GTPase ObgE [Lachnospiraceae bacterium]
MFADRAKIYVRSGKGGDGHVSFRREKYVPAGGPDGGDGGKGGDVIFVVDEGLNTLTDFRHVGKYKAKDGEEGGKKNCRGRDGEDIIIKVPEGTVIKEFNSGKVITDMSGDNRRVVLLKGGKGGNGNQHYATSTMQAPKYAQPGQPAQELELQLELKVIADVGLVGFPNVGKSTLLSRVSNARPKIANYHFTTLNPNLGVVDLDDAKGFVIADIPGLIEGASEGIGLGHEFLRHIERTKVIIHIVDAAGTEGRDPIADIYAINKELENYNADMTKKPQVIAANKTDAIYDPDESPIDKIRAEFEPQGMKVFPISAVSGQGLKELLYEVRHMLDGLDEKPTVFAQEYFPEMAIAVSDEPYFVNYDEEEDEYVVEGPRIEKMLGYTNLESEKGFAFFQNFLRDSGILDELEKLGIQEGDTVRMYGLSFDYYK